MASVAKSELAEAVKALLAENRPRLHEHCTLEELTAYHDGDLPVDRREDIADHIALCENCTILLLYGVIGSGSDEPQAESSPAESEESWRRLRPHLENRATEGLPLASLLNDRRPTPREALELALEISRALAALHAAGRVHPDLRAENILISPDGRVRLLERGFAPSPESLEVGYGGSAEAAMTELYRSLSPEQIAGEEPEQRSNLFSLGVLLYELMTGVSPFRAETPLATASRILSLEPVPASELGPSIDPQVSDLLGRLLAKEPQERPSSAAAVIRALESIAAGSEYFSPPAEGSGPAEQIERLYDEIIALTREQPSAAGSPQDEKIERLYAELLQLQTAEARRFRAQFEANLGMPIDAGARILDRARALREELEDLAATDAATQETDPS